MPSWLDSVVAHAHERLCSPVGERARAYLDSRGVTAEEIALFRVGLGYGGAQVPKQVSHFFLRQFDNTLVFPLTSTTGEVIGLQTRSLGEKRYFLWYASDQVLHPFVVGVQQALPDIWRTRQCVIVEGVFDLFAVRKVSPNVVAITTAHLRAPVVQFLWRYCSRVLCLLDMDKPGRAGTRHLQRWYGDLLTVTAPEYSEHDPADLLQARKYQELVALLAPAREVVPWVQSDPKTPFLGAAEALR